MNIQLCNYSFTKYYFIYQDAVDTLCTYFHPSAMEQLVENLINGVLERSQPACRKVGQLLSRLIKEHVLLKKQFEVGLKTILGFTPDLVVDIPKVWDYLGDLIGLFFVISEF